MPIQDQCNLKPGDKVTYEPKMEHGIVKEVRGDIAFVVYHCNNEWDRYFDYTGASTNLSDLEKGWIEKMII